MVVGLKCRQDVSSVFGINVCRLASIRICQAKRVLGQDVFSLRFDKLYKSKEKRLFRQLPFSRRFLFLLFFGVKPFFEPLAMDPHFSETLV